jgi:programmed cell death protein 5
MSDELEEIRQRKMQQLQEDMARHQEAEDETRVIEHQKELILKQILTPEARSRLTNIKLANPEFANQIEYLLIRLYQAGQVKRIDDRQLKGVLAKISGKKRDVKIIRK